MWVGLLCKEHEFQNEFINNPHISRHKMSSNLLFLKSKALLFTKYEYLIA